MIIYFCITNRFIFYNMKKLLAIVVLITITFTTSNYYVSAKPNSFPTEEEIEVRPETEDMTNPKSTRPKAPRVPIFITFYDNILLWDICYDFNLVQFVDKHTGDLFLEEYVPSGSHSVSIPSYLSGDLIVRLYNGNSWYSGEFIINN